MFGAVVNAAKAVNQRRMVVVDNETLAKRWATNLRIGLEVGWTSLNIRGFNFVKINETKQIEGKTFSNLILNLNEGFSASDIVRAISSIKGGGVVIMLVPKFEELAVKNLKYHFTLAIPPKKVEDCRHLFALRLIRKFYEHEGIWIYRDNKWEKESMEKSERQQKKKLNFPRTQISREVLSLVKTQNQIDSLITLNKSTGKTLIYSDIGRGKSATLGMFVASLRAIRNKKTEVIITSSSKANTKTFFHFLEKSLEKLNIPFTYKGDMLLGKKIKITYMKPENAINRTSDLLIVEDASTLSLKTLERLANTERVVFSINIHGYNGAGKTFLKNFKDFKLIEMQEPVLYAKNDLIEKWLFDTFCLDAEPAEISSGDFKILSPTLKNLFSDEKLLYSFIGIMNLTNYQNNPNALMTLADAPHHSVKIALSGNNLVGAVQYCSEGELDKNQSEKLFENLKQEGNLIPDILSKHYGFKDFAELKGLRIIKISKHPDLKTDEVERKLIFEIEKEKVDWMGVSFGATPCLTDFWGGLGFVPIAMSPNKNKSTGKFSLIMLKAKTEKAQHFVEEAKKQFSKKIMAGLSENYVSLNPYVVLSLLKSFSCGRKLEIDSNERKRLDLFISGRHSYEIDFDLILKLTQQYFLSGNHSLDDETELILISKVLQRKPAYEVSNLVNQENIYEKIREGIKTYFNNASDILYE